MELSGDILKNILSEGDIVFDIGANVGSKTVLYRKRGASVVCCEPQPDCAKALRELFADDSQVEILEVGLGSRHHHTQISVCTEANTISTLSERWKTGRFKTFTWDRAISVEIITLNDLIKKYGSPKYCKIDVEGYELEVLQGLSSSISYLSIEFCKEFLDDSERCVFYLMGLGYRDFNVSLRESNSFHRERWLSAEELLTTLSTLSDPEEWGDIWAHAKPTPASTKHERQDKIFGPSAAILNDWLIEKELTRISEPLRLHLGCGESHLAGYVNVDFPPDRHIVMTPKADFYIDVAKMDFRDTTVDEIRLHHLFEHFNRVTALAMLIRWHRWLKVGGKLHIETPDIMGSARTLLSETSFRTKMGNVRHLAGDQSAEWGYHVDHWFPQRFERTLETLGFSGITVRCWNWEQAPYLSNVEVTAFKSQNRSIEEQLKATDDLLWTSTVSDMEKPTYEIWRSQVRDLLQATGKHRVSLQMQPKDSESSSRERDRTHARPGLVDVLSEVTSSLQIDEIHDFNQRERDRWISIKACSVPAGSKVLDIGAGTCRYRGEFAHCDYQTHDFKKYGGYRDNREGSYGHIDYVSDIGAIPVPDESFDVVLCTEVLEHVPEPMTALKEMARIVRPGGRLFVTAPLSSGLHQDPYHFYGGFTPYWYQHFCVQYGLSVIEIAPNGGFFKLLAQECARVAWTMPQHEHLHGENKEAVGTLFGELLPRFLFALEERCLIDQFTVGYHVEAKKPLASDTKLRMDPHDI